MNLVVFDLDGTLASTFDVDEECFVRALIESLGIESPNTNWMEYEHVTDSGVVREAFTRTFGRAPNAPEESRFIECFVGLLSDRYVSSTQRFGEIPGAASLIRGLKNNSEWGIAIATGGWERSARLKMRVANLGVEDCPAAFAESGPAREAIVTTAIRKACEHYRQEKFERIVSVGDAAWDVQTAKRLRLPFVGVARTDRATMLRDLGATHVVEDLRSYDTCVRSFYEARIPGEPPLTALGSGA
jgi:phosphoglycolate phosphatase-like HAD superfamily hydrolase